jgi:hypothetical protein
MRPSLDGLASKLSRATRYFKHRIQDYRLVLRPSLPAIPQFPHPITYCITKPARWSSAYIQTRVEDTDKRPFASPTRHDGRRTRAYYESTLYEIRTVPVCCIWCERVCPSYRDHFDNRITTRQNLDSLSCSDLSTSVQYLLQHDSVTALGREIDATYPARIGRAQDLLLSSLREATQLTPPREQVDTSVVH